MSKMQRTKGASGELELADILYAELGMKFRRNLKQTQESEHGDLDCEDAEFPFLIECKRYAKGWTCSPSWEVQAFKAAEKAGKHPCVAYRFDKRKWRFRIWIDGVSEMFGATKVAGYWMECDAHGFCSISREIMARRSLAHRQSEAV